MYARHLRFVLFVALAFCLGVIAGTTVRFPDVHAEDQTLNLVPVTGDRLLEQILSEERNQSAILNKIERNTRPDDS